MIKFSLKKFSLIACCVLSSINVLCAQNTTKSIHKIHIQCDGPKHVTLNYIRAHLGIQEGQEFNEEQINTALRHLYKTGKFKNIRISKENETGTSLDIRVSLQVLPKIRKIEFVGNKRLKDNALLSEIKSRVNQSYNDAKLYNDCDY